MAAVAEITAEVAEEREKEAEKDARIIALEEALELRDALLDELQQSLAQSQTETREMLEESRALQSRLEANAKAQLAEKNKQIGILQGMVGELRGSGAASGPPVAAVVKEENEEAEGRGSHHVERPLHYDYLVTVLEERDGLADRLHDVSAEMLIVKAELAETTFTAERQAVRLRRLEREAKAAAGSDASVKSTPPSPTKPPRGAGAAAQLGAVEEELAETRKELAVAKANLEHFQRTEHNQRRKDSVRVSHLQEARQQVRVVGVGKGDSTDGWGRSVTPWSSSRPCWLTSLVTLSQIEAVKMEKDALQKELHQLRQESELLRRIESLEADLELRDKQLDRDRVKRRNTGWQEQSDRSCCSLGADLRFNNRPPPPTHFFFDGQAESKRLSQELAEAKDIALVRNWPLLFIAACPSSLRPLCHNLPSATLAPLPLPATAIQGHVPRVGRLQRRDAQHERGDSQTDHCFAGKGQDVDIAPERGLVRPPVYPCL